MTNEEKKKHVVVRRITSWIEVLNAARFTQRKPMADKEPSDKFKWNIIKAEHSPLRALMFTIDFYDIPYYASVHLCRHVHAQPFVSTSRPDIDGTMKPREEQKKSDPVNMRLLLNAQEIINISRARLCMRAEATTRKLWQQALTELQAIEPILAYECVPNCVYRGYCPEVKCCGYIYSDSFRAERCVCTLSTRERKSDNQPEKLTIPAKLVWK